MVIADLNLYNDALMLFYNTFQFVELPRNAIDIEESCAPRLMVLHAPPKAKSKDNMTYNV